MTKRREQTDIRRFSLAWRWTHATHAVFSDAVLTQLKPLSEEEAASLVRELRDYYDGAQLKRSAFFALQTHDASSPCSCFLSSLRIDPQAVVLLSWDCETALRTTWGVFEKHWDDFCYAASDDVAVVPESRRWLLSYNHEEVFEFGRLRA